jgi:maltose alpha-D-glucosyltransferase/alpha-amylase
MLRGPAEEVVRVSPTEADQSNTSLLYGDRLILKLFRRVEPGMNPDLEMSWQLTEKVGFTRVPAVAGAFEYDRSAEPIITIGMMQQLVESQADGWTHAIDELGRFYDQAESRAIPRIQTPGDFAELSIADTPPVVREVVGGYLDTAAILGRRTAEMHLALAADSSNPAFAPEPFGKEDLAAASKEAIGQGQRALQALEAMDTERLPADVAEQASRLVTSRDTLIERIRSASALEFTTSKIRVHGDYHLGQVLWAEGDFYIFDFEGEPARPLAQRREKQSPLKDVAGMVRSFSYAAYAELFAHTSSRPAEFARLQAWARIWQTWTTAAFLRGYFTTAADALFIPTEPSLRDALLRFFMLDKALYELNYELNNRPDWARIPLWGIFDLLK